MTSRTIDIDCASCGTYLFSLQPNDRTGLAKNYYCDNKECKQQEVIDTIKK